MPSNVDRSVIPTLFLISGLGWKPEHPQAGLYLLFYTWDFLCFLSFHFLSYQANVPLEFFHPLI
jgi:hypothetical protein